MYKKIKKQKEKTNIEKKFLKDYKHVDKFLSIHNNNFIKKEREKEVILNNINGYPLDEHQSKVVLSNEEATLVVAGAGSGKSLTIIGKIVYLINRKNIYPKDILVISFTNDATINLKKSLKKNYNFDIEIFTFHKLALRIIKDHKKEFIIAPDNYLEETIDTFFLCYSEKFQKEITILIGKNIKELSHIKRVIATFIHLFKANNYEISYFQTILKKIKRTWNREEYKKNKSLLLLIINIYLLYEDNLKKEQALDFDDMINKATTLLKETKKTHPWKYIIIDEYQDTSLTKFYMIEEIRKIAKAKLLVVGDDFQSIYRFTGCNLNIFLNFQKYFKNAVIFQIINTYRNPQELIYVAGSFVMKNKCQQKKNLISKKHLEKPIKIIYTNKKKKEFLNLLKELRTLSKDILVLGRNNKDIYAYLEGDFKEEKQYFCYKNIQFRYLTIHKAKGLESENVLIINMQDKMTGLPTKMKREKILKYVNEEKEIYPYEEERRLFYVALTRTKNYCYILSPYKEESCFTKEIKKYKKYVEIKKR